MFCFFLICDIQTLISSIPKYLLEAREIEYKEIMNMNERTEYQASNTQANTHKETQSKINDSTSTIEAESRMRSIIEIAILFENISAIRLLLSKGKIYI